MHIPDGFLTAAVYLPAAALAAGGLAADLKGTRQLEERRVPYLGAMGAFIFAAQMVNFPVAPGTSGHLLGGALAAIALGPAAAGVVMAAVLIIQALFMHDGGLLALGANILNMAIIAPWAASCAYRGLARLWPGQRGEGVAAFAAAWLSVLVSAAAAGLQLALSGVAPFTALLAAIAAWHALIGVGEGIITVLALNYLVQIGPRAAKGVAVSHE